MKKKILIIILIFIILFSVFVFKNKILKIKEVDFMFKIAKLEKVNNEKVIINLAT